eukprot:g9602.t1
MWVRVCSAALLLAVCFGAPGPRRKRQLQQVLDAIADMIAESEKATKEQETAYCRAEDALNDEKAAQTALLQTKQREAEEAFEEQKLCASKIAELNVQAQQAADSFAKQEEALQRLDADREEEKRAFDQSSGELGVSLESLSHALLSLEKKEKTDVATLLSVQGSSVLEKRLREQEPELVASLLSVGGGMGGETDARNADMILGILKTLQETLARDKADGEEQEKEDAAKLDGVSKKLAQELADFQQRLTTATAQKENARATIAEVSQKDYDAQLREVRSRKKEFREDSARTHDAMHQAMDVTEGFMRGDAEVIADTGGKKKAEDEGRKKITYGDSLKKKRAASGARKKQMDDKGATRRKSEHAMSKSAGDKAASQREKKRADRPRKSSLDKKRDASRRDKQTNDKGTPKRKSERAMSKSAGDKAASQREKKRADRPRKSSLDKKRDASRRDKETNDKGTPKRKSERAMAKSAGDKAASQREKKRAGRLRKKNSDRKRDASRRKKQMSDKGAKANSAAGRKKGAADRRKRKLWKSKQTESVREKRRRRKRSFLRRMPSAGPLNFLQTRGKGESVADILKVIEARRKSVQEENREAAERQKTCENDLGSAARQSAAATALAQDAASAFERASLDLEALGARVADARAAWDTVTANTAKTQETLVGTERAYKTASAERADARAVFRDAKELLREALGGATSSTGGASSKNTGGGAVVMALIDTILADLKTETADADAAFTKQKRELETDKEELEKEAEELYEQFAGEKSLLATNQVKLDSLEADKTAADKEADESKNEQEQVKGVCEEFLQKYRDEEADRQNELQVAPDLYSQP